MTLKDIIEEIKLTLTGGVLELEIDDKTIETIVKKAMREMERFWDETTLVTVPFASCIDLTDTKLDLKEKVNAIVKVYRIAAYGDVNGTSGLMDPMFAQQWMLFSNGGTMYNLSDYLMNYASWNSLLQTKNTISTDLAFEEDRHNNKLYINEYLDVPAAITIKYIPKLTDVELIQNDYWIDILVRLSTALTKIALGRIRTRFTGGATALWGMDGDKILEEGNSEYSALIERLTVNSNYVYPID